MRFATQLKDYCEKHPDKPVLERRVREQMSTLTGDQAWTNASRCRILTLEHHMAVRELIRKDQERSRLRDLLLAGAQSPPAVTVNGAYFKGLRQRVRASS